MNEKRRLVREAALWELFALDQVEPQQRRAFCDRLHQHLQGCGELAPVFFPKFRHRRESGQRVWSTRSIWNRARGIREGVCAHLSLIDALIARCSLHWKLNRMNSVDRNVLRVATYELAFSEEIPGRAILNEAIEIAKRYGSEDSGRFVNGILDRVAHELGRL